MARANVYTKDGKKVTKKGWKFYTILGTIAAVLVAGVVCLILWLSGVFSGKDNFDYFAEYDTKYGTTYELLNKKLNDENSPEHTVVFVYDNNEFDAKTSENDSEYTTEHEDIANSLVRLVEAIEKRNEEEGTNLFSFYILDTSIAGNEAVLTDSAYGWSAATEDSEGNPGANPNLLYFYKGDLFRDIPSECLPNFSGDVDSDYYNLGALDSSNTRTKLTSCLRDMKEYVENIYR